MNYNKHMDLELQTLFRQWRTTQDLLVGCQLAQKVLRSGERNLHRLAETYSIPRPEVWDCAHFRDLNFTRNNILTIDAALKAEENIIIESLETRITSWADQNPKLSGWAPKGSLPILYFHEFTATWEVVYTTETATHNFQIVYEDSQSARASVGRDTPDDQCYISGAKIKIPNYTVGVRSNKVVISEMPLIPSGVHLLILLIKYIVLEMSFSSPYTSIRIENLRTVTPLELTISNICWKPQTDFLGTMWVFGKHFS